jgi:hypothetical protein
MRVVGAVAVFAALAGCNGSASRAAVSGERSPDAASGFVFDVPLGPDPPRTACEVDATDPCPQPPSACTDAGLAVVYSGGGCTSGSCVWQKSNVNCVAAGGTCADRARRDGGDAGELQDASPPDGSVWVTANGCMVPAPAGPDPLPVACDVDASAEGGVCPPPPSVCASSEWIIYYDDGQCVSGWCVWRKEHTSCGGMSCSGGACHYLGTSAAAPN